MFMFSIFSTMRKGTRYNDEFKGVLKFRHPVYRSLFHVHNNLAKKQKIRPNPNYPA